MNARYRRLLACLLLALTLIMVALARPFAVFSDETLFEPVAVASTGEEARVPSLDLSAKRSRAVSVNWSAMRPQSPQIKLNLFDEMVVTAMRERVDTSAAVEGYVWVGRIIGQDNGHVALSVRGRVMAGAVSLNGIETYTIRYRADGQHHVVSEVEPATYLQPTAPDYVIPQAPSTVARSAEMVSCEDGSQIDLMVAYTAAARAAEGGQAAIEALINLRVNGMNQANLNSEVNTNFELVRVMEVDYEESGNLSTDLYRLMDKTDTHLNGIHGARDASKADLVALYVAEGNNGMCGNAFQMVVKENWFEAFAFGVSALDYPGTYTCNPLTLAHEFGHNMGNAHDRENAGGNLPDGFFAYGYQAPNNAFRTIMAYECSGKSCPRINHWSNPDVQYEGQPTGVDFESNPDQAADVARSLNELAPIVANFRSTCAPPTETPTPTLAATDTATLTPTATATSQVASPTATATNTPAGTATPTLIPPYSATPSSTSTMMPGVSPTSQAETTATITPSATVGLTSSPTQVNVLPTLEATPTIQPPVIGYHAFIPFTMR